MQLAECDTAMTRGDLPGAYSLARRSLDSQYHAQRLSWEKTVGKSDSTVLSPLGVQFGSLPEHVRLTSQLSSARTASGNLLSGGQFEDLPRLMQAGWRHFQHAQSGVSTSVDLRPTSRTGANSHCAMKAWAPTTRGCPVCRRDFAAVGHQCGCTGRGRAVGTDRRLGQDAAARRRQR